MNILYLHGFASSPASTKIQLLRPLLEPEGFVLDTPDLNVPSFENLDFDAMVAHAAERARRTPPAAIVGSSLGSLVALGVARSGIDAPLVLIAPALGIGARWQERLNEGDPVVVWNHARNAEAKIHRSFFERMNEIAFDDVPPRSRVTVIMGRDDETVPFELVEETWLRWSREGLAEGSKFIAVDGGDHSLAAHAELIAREIAAAATAGQVSS